MEQQICAEDGALREPKCGSGECQGFADRTQQPIEQDRQRHITQHHHRVGGEADDEKTVAVENIRRGRCRIADSIDRRADRQFAPQPENEDGEVEKARGAGHAGGGICQSVHLDLLR